MNAWAVVSLLLTAAIPAAIVFDATGRIWGLARPARWGAALLVAAAITIPLAAIGWDRVAGYAGDGSLLPIADGIDALIDWLVRTAGDSFSAINDFAVYWIAALERLLDRTIGWPLMVAIVIGIAYHASRGWRLPLGALAALLFVWMLQLWTPTMQTLSLMIVAIASTLAVGLPIGIAMARSNRLRSVLLPVLDLMQTMPSLVYLIPGVMLFGLGAFSAILATMVYAAPPLIRLTDLGIRQVDGDVTEAAVAFGASRRQILWSVQLPLALPSIMAGINQTIMMSLAMVVIASMIGVNGLGQEVLQGLMRQQPGKGFVAGLAIVLLVIVLDRITQAYGRRSGSGTS